MPQLYVNIVFPDTVDKPFTYTVPEELHPAVRLGVRVTAPFGKRTLIGFIISTSSVSHVPRLKAIQDILDTEPILSEEMLNLTKWVSEYYFAAWGDVLKAVLVRGATRPGKRMVSLTPTNIEQTLAELSNASRQTAIIKELAHHNPISVTQLQKKLGQKSILNRLNELSKRGYVTITEESPQHTGKTKFEKVIDVNETAHVRWEQWLKDNNARTGAHQHAIIQELLTTTETTISVLDLLKKSHASLSTLKSLEKKQLITITKREVIRSTEYDLYESSLGKSNIILNPHQRTAVETIGGQVQKQLFHTFLLYGITGSGKTQVYIETIRQTLALGKAAIVLVPEISLTPQIVRRFKFHFGDNVVAIHSRMSQGERYDAWRLTKEGKCSVVIGPRSAIFAPLKNIGLIVVDEEHEPSYKQFDQTPRYHARDVAIVRANECNAVVVLGSATPSFESYTNALNNKYTLLELPERVDNAKLPEIKIVDMASERKTKLAEFRAERKAEFKADPVKAREQKRTLVMSSVSDLLQEKIEDRLKKKEGIILLQNRRGFSPIIECPDCGHVEMCENCNIALTYHSPQKHLRCHYCGLVKPPPDICAECQSPDIEYRGFGTQRIEEELQRLFPSAAMLRMDLDTTTQKGSHDAILRKFSDGEVDILLGTQMVAKGLDFSRVTLVGVISAETQMLLPDFRSSERTFQLLTQVAGRAGRSTLAGEVIIQTYQPQHESLKHVVSHDFKLFYKEELAHREELHYPPFSRIALIEFKGKSEADVTRCAGMFSQLLLKQKSNLGILGPAPAALTRLKGLYRWHIVIKNLKENDPSGQRLHQTLKKVMSDYQALPAGKNKSVSILIDIDPVGMM